MMQGISPCDHVTERDATGELAFLLGGISVRIKAKADVRSRQKMHIRKERELRILS